MIRQALGTARDLKRMHKIATILIRYGFGDLVRRLGMATALEKIGDTLRWERAHEYAHMEPAVRFRCVLEDMGPTFVKLGQILSTRVDLFPPEWIAEFEKLQDEVPEVDFETLRPQIEEDLGAPPEEIFKDWQAESIAAASIAQVYRARLEDGTAVVIKVRRPGIRTIVEADLRLLKRLAEIAQNRLRELRRLHPVDLIYQFSQSLRRELDLENECRNAERVAENLAHRSNADSLPVIIPKVYWDWTCERLNVQEYMDGITGRDLKSVEAAGLDRKKLAAGTSRALLGMIIEDGFFHADPHPGNLFFFSDNRIALIDFGMVGYLSQVRREQVIELLHGLVDKDETGVVDVLIDWAGDNTIDEARLSADVGVFIQQYHDLSPQRSSLATMLADLMALLRDHELSLPPDLAMMFKVFVTVEGMARQLDPSYNLFGEAEPVVRRAFINRYMPDKMLKRGKRNLMEAAHLLAALPKELRKLLQAARSGSLTVNIELTRLEDFANALDRAASRLTVGLITAALIIGTAIVMTVSGGPTLIDLSFLGTAGFFGTSIGGIWILISIWRRR
ncbi:MAG: AarF/UbiB family protein [Pseudomonadota bacterium]